MIITFILLFHLAFAFDDDVEEVVVVTGDATASMLSEAVVATEVVTREQIEESGALTLDQVLDTVPGVQLLPGYRGPALSLRGHDPSHTLLLVDGRRTIGLVSGGIDLRRFPADEIERIEIVRGPTSALYGADAIGGVIHIITRSNHDTWFVEGSVSAGGYATAGEGDGRAVFASTDGPAQGLDQAAVSVSGGGRVRSVDVRAGVTVDGLDGWDRDPASPGTEGDAQRQIAPSLRLELGPVDKRVGVAFSGLVFDGTGTDGSATGAVLDRIHRTETWDLGLTGRFDVGAVTLATRLDGSVYRDQYRVDQRLSDALDTYEQTQQRLGRFGFDVSGTVGEQARHRLMGGVEALVEDIEAERIADGRAGRQRGAAHIQHTWRIHDRAGLVLLSGVRVEFDSLFGVFPAPRLALRLSPHEVVTLRLAGGVGFRAPDFKQLYLDFSNASAGYRVEGRADLRPEQSIGGAADLELTPHRLVSLNLSGWHDSLTDLISTDLVAEGGGQAAVYAYINVGRARVQGLGVSVTVAPREVASLSLSYTLTDADDLDQNRPLPGRAEHQGVARFQGRIERARLSGSVSATVLGPRAFYPTGVTSQATITPVIGLMDARVAWAALPELDLFVGVDNLLDAGVVGIDPTRPRRVYGGVSFQFRPKEKRHEAQPVARADLPDRLRPQY